MKEKIEHFRQIINRQSSRKIVIIFVSFVLLFATTVAVISFSKTAGTVNAKDASPAEVYNPLNDGSLVGVAGADTLTVGGKTLSNSWPGEIISSEISQIQPQREGVVTSWRVRIGDSVSAGEVLGKISAAPATPELIKMLAEQAEMAARTKSQATIADNFSVKERARLEALKNSISGSAASTTDLSFSVLNAMREKLASKDAVVRSFLERTLRRHATILDRNRTTSWQYFMFINLNRKFGIIDPNIQGEFESAFAILGEKLKKQTDLPIEESQKYFSLLTKLANSSMDDADPDISGFKTAAAEDQKEFLDVLFDYRMAQAEVADKETEYKIMISEGNATAEKERSMAHAEANAAEAAYNTVSREINGGSYVLSPRTGTISAIYKKVGDLVDPTMPIAVVAGLNSGNLTVRTLVPNNIKKPQKGELLSVVRPGFQSDVYKARIIGIGTSLDDTGSYMADAVLLDSVDWPAGASVRVIPSMDSGYPIIKLSSVYWMDGGLPYVWGISDGGRIFAKKISIARTMGSSVEIASGIKNGERYLVSPTPELKENMLLEDIVPKENFGNASTKSGGKSPMAGMGME